MRTFFFTRLRMKDREIFCLPDMRCLFFMREEKAEDSFTGCGPAAKEREPGVLLYIACEA